MILTVDQARVSISTGLTDDALLSMLMAAEADIVAVAGAAGALTEYHYGTTKLVLDHAADTFTSVTEQADAASPRVLATDDYRVEGYVLHRLTTGTNPRTSWDGLVKTIYTAGTLAAERERAQIALVRLDLESASGISAERIGDYSVSYGANTRGPTYQEQRAAVLASLKPPMVA